jgi:hypothetical protein
LCYKRRLKWQLPFENYSCPRRALGWATALTYTPAQKSINLLST